MDIFEKASRLKLSFSTPIGVLSVENLWDLPLSSERKTSLDSIAVALHRDIASSGNVTSFVKSAKKKADPDHKELKLDIVKRIIEVLEEENEKRAAIAATKERNARIRELIAKKQDETLSGKSEEELRQLLQDEVA